MLYVQYEATVSRGLVRADELFFSDMRLGPESFGSGYKHGGRVKNDSRYTVFEIRARIQLLDCDGTSHCDIVGDEEQILLPVIPPGQVRDIDQSVYFTSGTQVRGNFQWNYRITQVRAR